MRAPANRPIAPLSRWPTPFAVPVYAYPMLATHTIPIFLSLEPDDESARTVERFKQRVHERVGEQLYLSDPPHVTLYLAMFEEIDLVVDLARRCASSLSVEQAAISGWHSFLDDPLTGLNTLVLDFGKRDQDRLRALQMEIIESVSTSRDAP